MTVLHPKPGTTVAGLRVSVEVRLAPGAGNALFVDGLGAQRKEDRVFSVDRFFPTEGWKVLRLETQAGDRILDAWSLEFELRDTERHVAQAKELSLDLRSRDPARRDSALHTTLDVGDVRLAPALQALAMSSGQFRQRFAALVALAKMALVDSARDLIRLLSDPSLATTAGRALRRMTGAMPVGRHAPRGGAEVAAHQQGWLEWFAMNEPGLRARLGQ